MSCYKYVLPNLLSKSGVDLSGSAGLIAKNDTGANLATAKTIGSEILIGVIDQGGGNTSLKPVAVVNRGPVQVLAGAAFAKFANLTVDATSRAITAAAGDTVIGVAEEAAAAAGDLVHMNVGIYNWTLNT